MRSKFKLGDLIEQRREKHTGENLVICGVTKAGFIPPKQKDADTSLYNIFHLNDFVFNPARMELNSIVFNDTHEKATCSSLYEIFFVKRKDIILPEFLALIVKQDNFVRFCNFIGSGSAREYCRFANISNYEIEVPTLDIQKQIVNAYKTITDRIELKKKINDNLANSVKTIFKSWFLDFEAIDNVELTSSQYGKIPVGWHYELLGDLCKCVTKGTTPTTLGKEFTEEGINFIKGESINDDHSFNRSMFAYIDAETDKLLQRSRIKENDIVFTIAGTLGKFALVDKSIVPANTNQAVAIIRTSKIAPKLLYSYFIGDWQVEFYKKNTQQAVQANLSLTTIKELPILLADKGSQDKYFATINPLISAIKVNFTEIEQLAELQSQLLTRLSSSN